MLVSLRRARVSTDWKELTWHSGALLNPVEGGIPSLPVQATSVIWVGAAGLLTGRSRLAQVCCMHVLYNRMLVTAFLMPDVLLQVIDSKVLRFPKAVTHFSPGSHASRPRQQTSFGNVFIAGDWVRDLDHGANGLSQVSAFVLQSSPSHSAAKAGRIT